ncbi:MAG: Mercuric resistance operon regulatory protein [Saprospiraceae bacterium]|nr:Mercuric resistance operon regulatory protein [Saprospiraceae bacterium]
MTIGQLSRRTGYSKDTIRYYEKIGLITPGMYRRHENGYKDYSGDLVALLDMVALAKRHGFTLNELRHYLSHCEGDSLDCGLIGPMMQQKLAEVDKQIEALRRQRAALVEGLQRMEREC